MNVETDNPGSEAVTRGVRAGLVPQLLPGLVEGAAELLDVARVLEESAGRSVSRGALYTTLNRLEKKGLVSWNVDGTASGESRGGAPKRRFELTEAGMEALRVTQEALGALTAGLEGQITGGSR